MLWNAYFRTIWVLCSKLGNYQNTKEVSQTKRGYLQEKPGTFQGKIDVYNQNGIFELCEEFLRLIEAIFSSKTEQLSRLFDLIKATLVDFWSI